MTSLATEPVILTATDVDHGRRLDSVLASHIADVSRTRIKALILAGAVTENGRTISEPRHTVKQGDVLSLTLPEPEPATPRAQDIPLNVLFEDDAIIVIDKPAGLVVHPGAGNHDGTLVNALIAHCGDSLSGIGGVRRPGIVHRLDKNTSGVMVVAKMDAAHRALAAQFEDHGRTGPLRRRYEALVWGAPNTTKGQIDQPIGRSPANPLKMAVRKGGKLAITRYRLLERYGDSATGSIASRIECELETGRTHQIRVHMTHIGHPLLADPVYSTGYATKVVLLSDQATEAYNALKRQALHARDLRFAHPLTAEPMEFSAPLPDDLARLVAALQS